jgi:hypothetical protein
VFHDDQHGRAIVVLAALYNALRVVRKPIDGVRIVMSGGRPRQRSSSCYWRRGCRTSWSPIATGWSLVVRAVEMSAEENKEMDYGFRRVKVEAWTSTTSVTGRCRKAGSPWMSWA